MRPSWRERRLSRSRLLLAMHMVRSFGTFLENRRLAVDDLAGRSTVHAVLPIAHLGPRVCLLIGAAMGRELQTLSPPRRRTGMRAGER